MAENEEVPFKIRAAAWLCSTVIGVAVFTIFHKIIGTMFVEQGAEIPSRFAIWAGVIGIIAGTGSFSLIFANWYLSAASNDDEAAEDRPTVKVPEAPVLEESSEEASEETPEDAE